MENRRLRYQWVILDFFTYLRCVHTLIAYPEKAQRDLLHVLFSHTDVLEKLTGIPAASPSIEKEPLHGLFAFSYQGADDTPVYLYFRASTFGSPKTEYEQIREQASFIHRYPDAHYFALLLREAWFEWADDYIERRLELPMRRLGYEAFLAGLQQADLSNLSDALRQDILNYLRYLQKEYEGILHPYQLSEYRLRQYATLWHIRRAAYQLRPQNGMVSVSSLSVELDIRTQPHVHSSHLDQVFLRQYPAYRVATDTYEVHLLWELERDGLFLRVWLPPMREKVARGVHTYIRKQAQACIGERFALGRTRGTLKGIDTYHAREVNLLRIELPEMQQLLKMRDAETFQASVQKVATDLMDAIELLPAISERLITSGIPVRVE